MQAKSIRNKQNSQWEDINVCLPGSTSNYVPFPKNMLITDCSRGQHRLTSIVQFWPFIKPLALLLRKTGDATI